MRAIVLVFALVACGSSEDHGHTFDNLTDCVDDHADLGEAHAITHCLIDFPDLHPGFADAAECEAWVVDNGDYADVAADACADYFAELDA